MWSKFARVSLDSFGREYAIRGQDHEDETLLGLKKAALHTLWAAVPRRKMPRTGKETRKPGNLWIHANHGFIGESWHEPHCVQVLEDIGEKDLCFYPALWKLCKFLRVRKHRVLTASNHYESLFCVGIRLHFSRSLENSRTEYRLKTR